MSAFTEERIRDRAVPKRPHAGSELRGGREWRGRERGKGQLWLKESRERETEVIAARSWQGCHHARLSKLLPASEP